jgi:uncharacterized membrane protein
VKTVRDFVLGALMRGLMVVIPAYLAFLLLVKAMKSVVALAKPFAVLIPDWLPGEDILALLLVLLICFGVGVLVSTRPGRAAGERLEKALFERIPGYALFKSLAQRLSGEGRENVWKPALAEIEEALVPAFIIEELEDGRFTVFVPSVPTPLAGAVYVLTPERVHPLDVPFATAVRSISRWGSGSKDLVAAMRPRAPSSSRPA